MSDSPATPKQRMGFDWNEVSSKLVRELVVAAYGEDHEDLEQLSTDDQWRRQAQRVYGSPPSVKNLDRYPASWSVLKDSWLLQEASAEQLQALATYVVRGLPVSERPSSAASRKALRGFFQQRRLHTNFKVNLRRAFLQAHRALQNVRSSSGGTQSTGTRSGHITLKGDAARGQRAPYRHQVDALEKLDQLQAARLPDRRRGLVVLPTGGGKTFTAVAWLLAQLAQNPARRVLWLAHQQELLEQARDTLIAQAAAQPKDFRRSMRLISSAHSRTSGLAEADLDVALLTWQSVNHGWDERHRRTLAAFLQRPTIVVVDEAHHAGAPAYQRILKTVMAAPNVIVIGLTATPWPTASAAARRLRATFPVPIISVSPEELHRSGILAMPVLHTVDTGQALELTPQEHKAAGMDLPPSVLRQLATGARDQIVVDTWTRQRDLWDKTLVFATSKAHADRLGDALLVRDPNVRVLHSGVGGQRGEILSWFKQQTGPCVLVSVGMLTEGVDIPDAKTAILARPTVSRILMRQMVGRVLRGPASGGDAEAHVIYLRDQWVNFDETLEPVELRDLGAVVVTGDASERERPLPPILDTLSGEAIGEDLLAQIRRMYQLRVDQLPIDPATTRTRLVGYYETFDGNIPVMEHQLDGYDELLTLTLNGESFQGSPALSLFDDDHPPYPTKRAIKTVVAHAREQAERPPFQAMEAWVSPTAVAELIESLPAQTEGERRTWLREQYDTSLARLAYSSFDHFREAVDRERSELDNHRNGVRRNPEQLPVRAQPATRRLKNVETRTLPSMRHVADLVRQHLAGETVLTRLDDGDLPVCDWTRLPVEGVWAYWSLKTTGRRAGQPVVRVNRALQASEKHVPDEVLEYLLFHELLHHLLPGQGHCAEFRRLEGIWPNADQLDLRLDTLAETYAMKPSRR